jgi:hypothetical protein
MALAVDLNTKLIFREVKIQDVTLGVAPGWGVNYYPLGFELNTKRITHLALKLVLPFCGVTPHSAFVVLRLSTLRLTVLRHLETPLAKEGPQRQTTLHPTPSYRSGTVAAP